jgi:DNA replication protein DnaC
MKTFREIFNVAETNKSNCPTHGSYISKLIQFGQRGGWSECPACMEAACEAEGRRHSIEIERQCKVSKLNAELAQAAIPSRFLNRTLESYKATTKGQHMALGNARDYAANFPDHMKTGRGLILCGNPGTGKTHLAIGIAHHIIQAGCTVGFISVMNAVRRVRESYRRDSEETEREAIASFAKPDLLILDEVGQQRGTDDEKVILFDIVNARYEATRPTLVISNLNVTGIEGYLGERVFDRLREGGGRAVQFKWESFRKELTA